MFFFKKSLLFWGPTFRKSCSSTKSAIWKLKLLHPSRGILDFLHLSVNIWNIHGKVYKSPKNYFAFAKKTASSLLNASRTEIRFAPKDAASRPEGPNRKRRRHRLGGGLDRGWAERLEQAKMLTELNLFREDNVWHTVKIVFVISMVNFYSNIVATTTWWHCRHPCYKHKELEPTWLICHHEWRKCRQLTMVCRHFPQMKMTSKVLSSSDNKFLQCMHLT